MWKRHTTATRRTYNEGMMFWSARDAYRVQSMLYGLVGAVFLLEGLFFLVTGQWDTGLVTVGPQMLMCWGGLWLMRQLGGWGRKAVPAWWCGLVVIALLGGTLTGCESAAREVAKLHGVKVDPFPGQCAPESFQAGHCVVVRQGSVK